MTTRSDLLSVLPMARATRRQPFSGLVLTTMLVLAACGGGGGSDGPPGAGRRGGGAFGGPGRGEAGQPRDEPKVPVVVTEVANGDMEAFLDTSSTLEAEDTIDIVSEATGIVVEIRAEEGDAVRKGELLARLDYEELELAEQRARTELERLESDYARAEELSAQKLLSEEEFQQVSFDYRQAEIDYAQRRLELERTRIVSPISGTIVERIIRVGELKRENEVVYRIVDFDSLIAPVYIPEKYLADLRVGQPAILQAPALGGREVRGRVERISPIVNSQSGTIRLVIRPDTKGGLRPGMFATAQLVLDKHEDVVVMPKKALVYEDERPHVFVIENGRAHRRTLRLGYQDDDRVEILEGVDVGETVVVIGQSGLKEDSLVAAEDESGNPIEVADDPGDAAMGRDTAEDGTGADGRAASHRSRRGAPAASGGGIR